MERDEAIGHLPIPYAVALRLREAGVTEAQLAIGLAIEPEAVPTLLRIAELKLSQVLEGGGADPAPRT